MLEIDSILQLLAASPNAGALIDVAIGSGRIFGFLAVFPIFPWLGLNGILRIVISLAFAVPFVLNANIYHQWPQISLWYAIALFTKEILVGSLLGAVLGLPIWAAQGAGDMLASFHGANASNIFDPINSVEISVFGQLNAFIFMAWLVASGTLQLIFEILMQSYSVLDERQFSIIFNSDLHIAARTLLMEIAKGAIVIAAPMLTIMFIAELALNLANRSSKQFSFSDLTTVVKTTVAVVSLPIYASFLFVFAEESFTRTVHDLYEIMVRPR